MKSRLAAVAATFCLLSLAGASAAFADAQPPTNGGNGAGQSGQCTGNPDDRPAGLDCAH